MHNKRARFDRQNDPFDSVAVFLPKKMAEIIKMRAAAMGLPVSRLICYAIDNELDAPVPFTYATELPLTGYTEFAYSDEAQKIYNYLLKFPSGIGRDYLVLCRRDFGIASRDDVLLGLRELIEQDVVREVNPPGNTKFKGYKEDYKYIQFTKHFKKKQKEKDNAEGTSESILDKAQPE